MSSCSRKPERRHALTWSLSPGVDWDDTDLSTSADTACPANHHKDAGRLPPVKSTSVVGWAFLPVGAATGENARQMVFQAQDERRKDRPCFMDLEKPLSPPKWAEAPLEDCVTPPTMTASKAIR
jgi:hypothetical protein